MSESEIKPKRSFWRKIGIGIGKGLLKGGEQIVSLAAEHPEAAKAILEAIKEGKK